MTLSNTVSTLIALVGLLFIALGIWFGQQHDLAPTIGFLLGILFFLLSVKISGKLKKRERMRELQKKQEASER